MSCASVGLKGIITSSGVNTYHMSHYRRRHYSSPQGEVSDRIRIISIENSDEEQNFKRDREAECSSESALKVFITSLHERVEVELHDKCSSRIIRSGSIQAKNLIRRFSGGIPKIRHERTKAGDVTELPPAYPPPIPCAQSRKSRIVIVPENHPLKILWNVLTVLLTFVSAYTTHTSIRDRRYDSTALSIFTEAWFVIDILLNFVTAHRRPNGTVIRSGSAVWAWYLTTWFPIDALALVPWERMYLSPIIKQQNSRKFVTKLFFRSRATVKVTVRHPLSFGSY